MGIPTLGRPSARGIEALALTCDAQVAYVAVETATGPHVTPVLFATAAGRVWFVVDRRTLKARVIARRPDVGILVWSGDRAVVIAGQAMVLDPVRPTALKRAWPELVRAPLAASPYTLSNALELAGTARDAARFPGRLRPDTHVLVSVAARTTTVVPSPSVPSAAIGGPAELELVGVPAQLAARAQRPGPAVLGWPTGRGPLALPVAWDPDRTRARVAWPRSRAPRTGREVPVSLCFDASRGHGPSAKAGLMLRGPGRVTSDGDLVLRPRRATFWTGFETATRELGE
ncbi:MAG TPA: pyridoxamine 5'-phosphate oxidase family protein [Solirubrobacteraceae bacterium]|jgi:hypothetical protein|nr:pyridoxamine 5'-phosphate oxidase family protein [Solirubrobacteraceae bacterium]